MSIEESAETDAPILAWEALGHTAIGRTTTARCEMMPSDVGCAVILYLDDDVLVAEMSPDRQSAAALAEVFRATLVAQGCWLLMPY